MNKKIIHSITLGFAISAASVFAADEAATAVTTVSSEEISGTPQEPSILERLEALENSSKKSDWSEKVKIKADLRYRYEYIGVDGSTDENRQRIRVRLGAYADVNDFTTAGIRIRTGGGANSGNQTIGGGFNSKNTYFDLAYMTIALNSGECGAVTLGKMKYPWMVPTDMIWDGDVNPEGIAYTYTTTKDETGLFGSAGGFKVQEDASAHDLNLISLQAGATQPLNDDTKLTAGGSIFAYANAVDFGAPVDYTVVQLFSEVSFKELLPLPFKVVGDYVNNTEENDDNQGICLEAKFGDAKKGKWEAKLGYRRLEANAAPSAFADSDYAGGGTDIEGFRAKGAYNIGKHLQAGVTLIAGEQISSGTDVNTMHLDLIASF